MTDAANNGRVSLVRVVRGELQAHVERFKEWRTEHREAHDKMDERISEMEKLAPAIRAITWVGVALGLSIIGLIWSMVTGQVQLIFR